MLKKICYGFSDIHIAKREGNKYLKPVLLEGAKSVEANLNFTYKEYRSGKKVKRFSNFEGGEGTLGILGLNKEEYQLLFGSTVENNKVIVSTNNNSPELALMFSRENIDGTKKCYCLYSITCKPVDIGATTIEGGSISEDIVDIEFFIDSIDDKVYYIDDENDFFEQVRL